MDDFELCYLPAQDVLVHFADGSLLPIELIDALARRTEAVGDAVNAFTVTHFERARDEARAAAQRWRDGTARPLEGVPVAIKDSCEVAGDITTHGSKVYENHRPNRTHPGVARLLEAGAILIARTTMPEFGEAGNCYTPLWGVTRNPWNLNYGPGGSSSGAGAALAAGMTTIADGSDIGGSIRIPAACCNVLGYKAPYGRNPNAAIASFDPYQHYGPLARTVADIALMQNVISGVHVDDIGTLREELRLPLDPAPAKDWKIALSMDLGYFQVDPEVRRNTEAVAVALEAAGNTVEEVELGWTEEAFDAWLAVNATRGAAARKVGDFERWRPHLADYTVDMIEHGQGVGAEELVRALEVHVEMYARLAPMLEEYRVLICPTNAIPSVAADRSPLDLDFEIGGEKARPKIAAAWFMTYPFNMLSQLPVLSVPSGFAANGVPTGVQIVARSYDDLAVMRVARTLEEARPWADARPALAS